MKEVRSRDNPHYKALRRLVHSSQERKRTGLSVLDGMYLVTAYCGQFGRPEYVVVNHEAYATREVQGILEACDMAAPLVFSDALFHDVSSVSTPTGIIAVVRTPRPRPPPSDLDVCVILEDLQDPGNLGSILRSCAAAGVEHVLLSAGSVHAWSPRVLRAGTGAHFALSIHEGADVLAAAQAFSGTVIATDRGARRSLFNADLTGRVALLFGNEGCGLSRALRATAQMELVIPIASTVESLNVAASVAVCLFERARQLEASRRAVGGGGADAC